MKGLTRLEVYDKLRDMRCILKDIPQRKDAWEQNALDGLSGTLYMAEGVFARSFSPRPRKRLTRRKSKVYPPRGYAGKRDDVRGATESKEHGTP